MIKDVELQRGNCIVPNLFVARILDKKDANGRLHHGYSFLYINTDIESATGEEHEPAKAFVVDETRVIIEIHLRRIRFFVILKTSSLNSSEINVGASMMSRFPKQTILLLTSCLRPIASKSSASLSNLKMERS